MAPRKAAPTSADWRVRFCTTKLRDAEGAPLVTDGAQELLQLAELMRLGVATARKVALLRPRDRHEIEQLCRRAETIASELVDLVGAATPRESAPGRAN